MTIKTTEEQLEAVQEAIAKAEMGQAVSYAGRSITRADLRALYDREAKLLQRYNRENGTGGAPVRTTVILGGN